MAFNSMTFLWIFLPISLVCYFLINNKYRNIFLIIASLIFYAWGDFRNLGFLAVSLIINYLLSLAFKNKKRKKFFLVLSIIFNVVFLGYFKYANFFLDNVNKIFGTNHSLNILLPMGISFYTFSIISYIVDVYKEPRRLKTNFCGYLLYVLFFPKLIMGPIEKYSDFREQIKNHKVTKEKFVSGVKKFGYGLAKKVLIADTIAGIPDLTFSPSATNLTPGVAWLGIICYALQIYYDFSGYSDMAIGLAKMFGFDIKENFNLPYTSTSITDFWRRWHISLGAWFRNYIYIPLGGNRKGNFRTYLNLFVVFLLTGLWHGSSWSFVFWGLWHGFFTIIERIKLKEKLDKNKYKIINYIYTDLIVLIGWVFFRAGGMKHALKYLKVMFFGNNLSAGVFPMQTYGVINHRDILAIIIGILFAGIFQLIFAKFKNKEKIRVNYMRFIEPIVLVVLFGLSILCIVNSTYNSFIYANF